MLPFRHLIFVLFFSFVLFLLFPSIGFFGFLLIILSSILIDVDHYVYHIYKKRDFSLTRAYNWYINNRRKTRHLPRKEKKKIYFGFCFFHGIEIIGIIYLLHIYISQIFLFVLIGFSLHLVLDMIIEFIDIGRTDKISVIYSLIISKRLKFVDDI